MNTAAIYVRSANAQSIGSVEEQLAQSRDYAKRMLGKVTLQEFRDVGSGATMDRPGLTMLIDFCSRNHGTPVIVCGTERLGRTVDVLNAVMQRLSEAKAKVMVVDRGLMAWTAPAAPRPHNDAVGPRPL